ncbi:MAG: YitT family protein [Streptococcaceae bacterium]|jgi:uncharacterized membrane-anchored protein YitT (DUF2179 family)|nr:YitT family protein [Streptococcaceae bacterium]
MIGVGSAIYAFGFVEFNMANRLAEGGIAGLTLIGHALWGINPALTQILLNIPLLVIGWIYLGRRMFAYTIFGNLSLSFFIWLFQIVHIFINVDHDMLIASLLAGVAAGVGIGIIFRFGGTSGGSDIIARLLREKRGIPFGTTFLTIDAVVLTLSLSYINLHNMMYTLIASFVASQVLEFVQSGGYTVRGMLIISQKYEEVSKRIMDEVSRGATYLDGEGVYSGAEKKIIYVVLNPREIMDVKNILAEIDPQAFVSIINVHEVMGDFLYAKKRLKK